jgi:hypothetical protein
VDDKEGVIPPTWQIQPCWTEPLRVAGRVLIGKSIFPFGPEHRGSVGMAKLGRNGSRFASSETRDDAPDARFLGAFRIRPDHGHREERTKRRDDPQGPLNRRVKTGGKGVS